MFKTSITATPLTTNAANSYFHNITGDKFGNDNSFLATLRALVAPRIKDEESIHLIFGSSSYDTNAISSVPADRMVRAIFYGYYLNDSVGAVIIHSFSSTQENNMANFRLLESKFTACFPGYHRLKKIGDFYRKSFCVDCYINPELKNVIVLVDNLDNKKLHYLQASILAFLPWYFNPEDSVSDDEIALLYSLLETNADKYTECINKIAEKYDFKSARIRQMLRGFETRSEKIEYEKVQNEISRFDAEIDRLNDQIGFLLGKRNDTCIKLLGLERKIANSGQDSEIMDYFLCNNHLYLEDATQSAIYFSVKDYLTYFDSEMAEQTINNPRSFVYINGDQPHNGITPNGMRKLMMEIFVNEMPRLRIKFCAAYSFDLNGGVRPIIDYNFTNDFSDYMPNPHINAYGCMGNYVTTINRLLKNRDYIGAVEQCIASCKSLNWGDSTVMRRFIRTMWGEESNNRCIELPDGNVVRPADAIKWLEQQEANTNEHEAEES